MISIGTELETNNWNRAKKSFRFHSLPFLLIRIFFSSLFFFLWLIFNLIRDHRESNMIWEMWVDAQGCVPRNELMIFYFVLLFFQTNKWSCFLSLSLFFCSLQVWILISMIFSQQNKTVPKKIDINLNLELERRIWIWEFCILYSIWNFSTHQYTMIVVVFFQSLSFESKLYTMKIVDLIG